MRNPFSGTAELEQRVERLEAAVEKLVVVLAEAGCPTSSWMRTICAPDGKVQAPMLHRELQVFAGDKVG